MTFCTQGNKTGMTWNVLYYHQSDSVTDRGVQCYVTVTSSDLPPIQPSSHINHKSHIKNIKSHKIETMWQKKNYITINSKYFSKYFNYELLHIVF